MDVIPISNAAIQIGSIRENADRMLPGATSSTQDGPFSDVVRGLMQQANAPHIQADQALQQLISGETDNVHNVVLSVAKADMSFRFLLELRNRLTEAYQEVMRMQV